MTKCSWLKRRFQHVRGQEIFSSLLADSFQTWDESLSDQRLHWKAFWKETQILSAFERKHNRNETLVSQWLYEVWSELKGSAEIVAPIKPLLACGANSSFFKALTQRSSEQREEWKTLNEMLFCMNKARLEPRAGPTSSFRCIERLCWSICCIFNQTCTETVLFFACFGFFTKLWTM